MPDLDIERLEGVLAAAFGSPVTIGAVERIAPWFVARLTLEDRPAGTAETVILKWPRSNDMQWRTDGVRTIRERIALEFLEERAPGCAPRVVAADDDAPFLVVEDMSPCAVLWDLLAHNDPRAFEGMREFAAAMGTLHARTVGADHDYYPRVAGLDAATIAADRRRVIGETWDWSLPPLPDVDRLRTARVDADVALLVETLLQPSPFDAFTNGDSGANNFLVTADGGRIIDFEGAGFRHALIDAACLHVPGPMWMTVADPVPTGVANVYRGAIVEAIPAATDDRVYGIGLAGGCLAMAIERLELFRRRDERPPGHESRAQMISALEAAVRAATHFRAFPHLSGWASGVAEMLRARWPESNVDFPNTYTTRSER